jgi:metal-sulfur cluster biosynthetic enzyme
MQGANMENIDEKELMQKVIERLKLVYDPEIPVNIYDMGLVYGVEFEYKNRLVYCYIKMTLTSPSCPVAGSLVDSAKYAVQSLDEIYEAYVELVFDPIWDKEKMTQEAKEVLELSGMVI